MNIKSKLLPVIEKFSIKAKDEKSADALTELSSAYLKLNNLSQAIILIEQALKCDEDSEWRRSYIFDKIIQKSISQGNRTIFESIISNKDEEYKSIYEGVLDLKQKKYDSAFDKLAQLDEDDYEFFSEVTELIKEVLPNSLRLFPINIINEKLSPTFLKEQVITDFLTMIVDQASPSVKKQAIKLFKKYSKKDEKKSYINDYTALISAKEGNLQQALKYASKACDLREVGLLKQISKVLFEKNEKEKAIETTLIEVKKNKSIDWNYYAGPSGPIFAQFSSGQHVIESLIPLARLFHSYKNHDKVKTVINEIVGTIEALPEEDFYGEWKANQYFMLMDLAIEINDLGLLENAIKLCTPLEIKNKDGLNINTDNRLLQSIIKHKKNLNNKTINPILKLIGKPLNDKSNDIKTQVTWVKLLDSLNKIEQAKKLSNYILVKIKSKDDYFNIYDIASIHFKIHETNEIEDRLNKIGVNKAAIYLHGVAKNI